ncbi:MAG TPA: arylesterase [Woeseiaceae bacterium]|nr:arylesterase [Woeseiaceae bacterium]
MRKLLTLLLILGASTVNGEESPTVLVLGDSLSAGYGIDVDQSWTALLQSRLQAEGYEHRVVNASISGETTEGGAARIASALSEFNPEVVVIALGGNDGLRGFPPERIKTNLGRIVDAAAEKNAAVVLLGIRIPTNYGPRYTSAFENVYRELASERDLPWIEFFMEGVALDEDLMQDDGIHPNEKAQPVLLDNAWPVIQQALKADVRTEQNTK